MSRFTKVLAALGVLASTLCIYAPLAHADQCFFTRCRTDFNGRTICVQVEVACP